MSLWPYILAGMVGLFAMLGAALFWGARNAPTDEELREEYEAWLGAEGYKDSGGLDP